jgi:hypothetical protein
MSSLHVLLDTQDRKWEKPPVKGVYCAVLDIGDLDYDQAALQDAAQRLAKLLLEAVFANEP